jgi:phospholipid/cholesterol/gamma-HCH transport system substrate-binding protein
MDKQRSAEIKVGIVTIVGVVLLILGILLGKGITLGVSSNTIIMAFPNSGGIEIGSPVFVNGMKRGVVTLVENAENKVLVTAQLDNIDDVKKDATARILMLELTGGKKIEVNPGTVKQPITNKDIIAGIASADATQLIADVGDVANDAKRLVRRLDTISGQLTAILGDTVFINNIKGTATKANTLLTSLNEFYDANKGTLQSTIQQLKGLTDDVRKAVNTNEPAVRSLLAKLETTTNDAQTLLNNANASVGKLDALLVDVRSVVQDIKQGEGVVSKMLYDKKTAQRLDSVLNSLGTFVDKVKEHGLNTNVRLGTRP